jgi:hypothetical protein
MNNPLTRKSWSPYVVGAAVGVLSWFALWSAVFGYCPGTSVAACGEGRRDAMVGVLGMLVGAAVYVALFPALQPVVKGLGDAGKVTLPEVVGTSAWPWVVGLALVGSAALWLLRGVTSSNRPSPGLTAPHVPAESRYSSVK